MESFFRRNYLIVWLLLFFPTIRANVIQRSAPKPPEWVKKGEKKYNDQRFNNSYYFKIIEDTGRSLEEIKGHNLAALASAIGQANRISQSAKSNIFHDASTGEEHDQYTISFSSESKTENFHAKLVDEYWEQISSGGSIYYQYYALYAISTKSEIPNYDHFSLTTSYGAGALARSLIPGVGQMYKGSNTKGLCIIAGEVACVGGILYCESMRSSYHNKMIEQPKHAQEYHSRADNFETARNICIGAAAALYVYNLIDAAVANGARRLVIKKNNGYSIGLRPSCQDGNTGVALCLNF